MIFKAVLDLQKTCDDSTEFPSIPPAVTSLDFPMTVYLSFKFHLLRGFLSTSASRAACTPSSFYHITQFCFLVGLTSSGIMLFMYLLFPCLPLPVCELLKGADSQPSALLFPRAQSSGWYIGMF